MRYILYDPNFTKKDPFFRIGNEGVGKKELLLGFIEAEMPENLKVTRFGDLVITDLDTLESTQVLLKGKRLRKLYNC